MVLLILTQQAGLATSMDGGCTTMAQLLGITLDGGMASIV